MSERKTSRSSPERSATQRGGRSSGRLFVVSAPSGAGKTTLCRAVLAHHTDILYSISYTTRPARNGEKNAVDYYFISESEFKKGISQGKWVEWAKVHGHYYGTSAEFLNNGLVAGKDILLDIDVQGTLQIREKYPDCITIFIVPPSLKILRQRLESRGTDSQAVIEQRIHNAEDEMGKKSLYQHVIVNDRLPEAKKRLISLIQKYR
jgi:guanylate kinase